MSLQKIDGDNYPEVILLFDELIHVANSSLLVDLRYLFV